MNSPYFVFTVESKKEVDEYELLFQSKEIPYSLHGDHGKWRFFIPENFEREALRELSLFQKEGKKTTPPLQDEIKESSLLSPVHDLTLFFLFLFHWKITNSEELSLWLSRGRFSAAQVLEGEWERTVTALTLHGGYGHLLGNIAALWIFGNGLSQYVGTGVAWFLILLSGALGNTMNAFFYQTGHYSIGASTATFGALGLMGGIKAVRGWGSEISWRRWFVPIAASVAVLAMLGVSPETDVMAHIFGLISGLLLGAALSKPLKGIDQNKVIQIMAFLLFAGAILYCWHGKWI